ncbi:MAG: amino acid permease [Candidatus Aphodousia sp.]|nr:amino acid permease [Sutterella sp.]MDY2899590.1 amino acid permease [Candidatus Aphodousia sp.]
MNSQNTTANNESQFQRSMQLRHLIMLSLGGVIGSGLFFGTGHIIANVGAFGTVVAYLIGAFMVYLIMLSLGELSVAHPDPGSFHVYASRYISPASGYAVAWLYWLNWTVTLGTAFTAVGFAMQYWFPNVPVWTWCIIFGSLIFLLNVIDTRFFAESEFYLSLIKVITIQAFIILGACALFDVIPFGENGSPGLTNLVGNGELLPNGIAPLLFTMVTVCFAYSGTELIGVAAGETNNPERVIPLAVRASLLRLVIFFVGTVLIVAMLVPSETATVSKSPFMTVFEELGIPYAADIFNFVIITAILSSANTGLFASGRMVWSLGHDGMMPAGLAKLNKRGVPVNALAFSMLGGLLALASSVMAADTVFVILTSIVGFSTVAVWLSICVAHYRFRKQFLANGHNLDELKYKSPMFPLVPILGGALCLVVMIGMGIDPDQRVALYCGIPFTVLCYVIYHMTQKVRKNKPTDKSQGSGSPRQAVAS